MVFNFSVIVATNFGHGIQRPDLTIGRGLQHVRTVGPGSHIILKFYFFESILRKCRHVENDYMEFYCRMIIFGIKN